MGIDATLRTQYLGIVIFTRRMAIMVKHGITLRETLDLLGEDSSLPSREMVQMISNRLLANEPLSAALAEFPDVFSPFYRTIVRAGEIGGILDDVLRHLADILEQDWKYSQAICASDRFMLFFAEAAPAPDDLLALNAVQQLIIQVFFCRCFGRLLASGVPILQSMSVTADLLPATQRKTWLAVREGIREGKRLENLTFLPRFTQRLIVVGEETGTLDSVFCHAADILQHEMECRLAGCDPQIS